MSSNPYDSLHNIKWVSPFVRGVLMALKLGIVFLVPMSVMLLVWSMELQLIQWWSADEFQESLEMTKLELMEMWWARMNSRLVIGLVMGLARMFDWSTEMLVMLLDGMRAYPLQTLMLGLLLVIWYNQPPKAH
jgi:hypothetical protein